MQHLIRKYHTGTYVYREREDGDYAFILRTGKVRLTCQQKDVVTTLEDIHEGRLFGETALVERTPRLSSAVAVAGSECYAIDRREFLGKMMRLDPERMKAFRNMLLFVARVPLFDARGTRLKTDMPAEILQQIGALYISDLALSLTKTGEPVIDLVAEQIRFEVERRLPRDMRPAPPPPPPSPIRDKLKAHQAAVATATATIQPAAPAPVSAPAAAAPAPAAPPPAPSAAPGNPVKVAAPVGQVANAAARAPSFDMRKV